MNKHLSFVPEALDVFCRYNLLQPLFRYPFLPRAMLLIPTHRCNARCIMCGIWQERATSADEMTLRDFETLLNDRLFSRLEYVGINGGEPFLREDLAELVELFQHKCPRLKRLSITTNGILTKKIESKIERMVGSSKRRGVLLDVSISMHAVGSLLSHIYGVEAAFDRICRSLEILKRYRQKGDLTVSLNCVLLNDNLETAPGLLKWAEDNDLPISFVVGEQRERFGNTRMTDIFIGPEKKGRLIQFLKELSTTTSFPNFSAVKYKELIDVIEGKRRRSLSCYYSFSGFMLGYDGTIYYCPHSQGIGNCQDRPAHKIFYDPHNLAYRKKELFCKECRYCPPYTLTRMELEKNIHKVVKLFLEDKIQSNVGKN